MSYVILFLAAATVVFAALAKHHDTHLREVRNNKRFNLSTDVSEWEIKKKVEWHSQLFGLSLVATVFALMFQLFGGGDFNPCPTGQTYAPFYLNGQYGYQCIPSQPR